MITKLNQELFSLQKVSTCQGGSNWWDRFSHGSSSHNFELCKRKVCFRPTMETRTAMLTQPQVRKNQLMPPRKGTPILLSIDRAMAYVYALARPIQLLASGLHFCQAGHLSPTTWTPTSTGSSPSTSSASTFPAAWSSLSPGSRSGSISTQSVLIRLFPGNGEECISGTSPCFPGSHHLTGNVHYDGQHTGGEKIQHKTRKELKFVLRQAFHRLLILRFSNSYLNIWNVALCVLQML